MLDEGVGGRGEQALVAILPPDQVGRRAALTVDLYHNSLAINVAHMASPDYQFIADYSMHRSPPSPRIHLIKSAEDASSQEGPKVARSRSAGEEIAFVEDSGKSRIRRNNRIRVEHCSQTGAPLPRRDRNTAASRQLPNDQPRRYRRCSMTSVTIGHVYRHGIR